MKKLLIILFTLIFGLSADAELLKAEISMVPQSFYGTWRVVSKLIDTDSPSTFKDKGLDLWNLSRTYDVITLCNPFNGAKSDITVKNANKNHIIFTKTGKYDKKVLSDRVELSLNGDNFTGVDILQLDTYVNGKIVKSETAKYDLKGEKIGGGVIE